MAKTEGTSQTFGQLIKFPTKEVGSTNIASAIASVFNVAGTTKDIIVKLIPGNNKALSIKDIDVEDRFRIIASAFSDIPTSLKTATITQDAATQDTSGRLPAPSTTIPNIEDYAIVAGTTCNPNVKTDIKRALKADLFIALKSKESEEIEFNNIKQIDLSGEFVYNFFTTKEKDYLNEEDPRQDPFLISNSSSFEIPRYIKLRWTPQMVTENLSEIENDAALLTSKKIKNASVFFDNGQSVELVDIHRIKFCL
jgi:hypothetical protein